MPVVSSNNSLRDLVVAGNDRHFAEALSLEYRDGAQPDRSREDRLISAVLRTRDEATVNISGGRGADWKSEVRAGGAKVFVDLARYPDLQLKKGDVVRAIDRPGRPRWKVVDVDARAHDRLVVELTDAS